MQETNNIDEEIIAGIGFGEAHSDYRGHYQELFNYSKNNLEHWTPDQFKNEGSVDVLDFFSGCGGMSLGFAALSLKIPIFKIRGGIDINEVALTTYRHNFKSQTLLSDIRQIYEENNVDVLKKYFGLPAIKERPLVVIGCAPCQGFSSHRKKHWSKVDDRNTLIGAFAEIATKLDPDFIVMENVPEILGKKYWEHYEEARKILSNKKYNITQRIYNSASFGVPQERFRAIIVASKKKITLPPEVFGPDEFRTVRDAIGGLEAIAAGEISNKDVYHRSAKHKETTIETIAQIPKNGGNRPVGVGPKCLDKVNGFYDVYGRLHWDKPAITITKFARNPASGRFVHPEQNRGLTIREAARLQSFPDGFYFSGSLDANFSQIGEAVPPLLSCAIATTILIELLSNSEHADNGGTQYEVRGPISSSYSSVIASLKRKKQ